MTANISFRFYTPQDREVCVAIFDENGLAFFAVNDRVATMGKVTELTGIKIAASHLSAPLIAKHDAIHIREVGNGWGISMHRIDMELKL